MFQYPPALIPVYLSREANESISLYSGPIDVVQNSVTTKGTGNIKFVWLPTPRLSFEWTGNNLLPGIMPGSVVLKVNELGASVDAIAGFWSPVGRLLNLSGVIIQPLEIGTGSDLKYVLFHVINFGKFQGQPISFISEFGTHSWVGRMVLEAEGWRVTIDSVRYFSELENQLGLSGGYAITHVGKLEQNDGRTFTAQEANNLLTALNFFLSFCRGFSSPPILPVGFDANDNGVWTNWDSQNAKPWRYVDSWLPAMSPQTLTDAFSGFFKLWQDVIWKEPLKMAIHWYVEANTQAGTIQGSIALSQVALEMLSWVRLVEAGGLVSTNGFDNLPGADKLRLLLSQCGIPLGIPSPLTNFAAASSDKAWSIAPYALTEIRNAIVHSTLKKRQKLSDFSNMVLIEAWKLSLWYLELVLLSSFGYRGAYHNRLPADRFYGDEERVPWL